MTSDGRGRVGAAESDFISKGPLTKHLMRGEVGGQKRPKSSGVIYGRPLSVFIKSWKGFKRP